MSHTVTAWPLHQHVFFKIYFCCVSHDFCNHPMVFIGHFGWDHLESNIISVFTVMYWLHYIFSLSSVASCLYGLLCNAKYWYSRVQIFIIWVSLSLHVVSHVVCSFFVCSSSCLSLLNNMYATLNNVNECPDICVMLIDMCMCVRVCMYVCAFAWCFVD